MVSRDPTSHPYGWFDQTAPLDRLSGVDGCVYSIDLKAATDRWPLLWMIDVFTVSIKKVLTAQNPLGWYNFMLSHPKQLRLSTQLRLAGFGFKAASRPGHASTHGRRCRRLLIMRLCGILPSTLWLSVSLGRWIRPEIVGAIVDRLRDHFLHNCLLRKSFFILISQTLMKGLFIRGSSSSTISNLAGIAA